MWFDESFFEEFRRMKNEMDQLFNYGMASGHPPLLEESKKTSSKDPSLYRRPLTDIMETESAFIASIELPGVNKEDIELTVTERVIEVKVDKREERKIEDKEKGIFKHSLVNRQFYRSFPLPKPVVPEKAKAELRNGILRVEVPKTKKTSGSHRVTIT